MFLNNRFSAQGDVNLLGAEIGGNLTCTGGTFKNPGGYALDIERAHVKGNVFVRQHFSAQGTVNLADARIEGDLNCIQGVFKEATLDLTDAVVSGIRDDPDSWPQRGNLILDGFVYKRIFEGPRDAESRLAWLALTKNFTTQPYLQLAQVLRDAGDDDGAKAVTTKMEDERRKGDITRLLLKWGIGYGLHPLWAGGWGLLLTGIGWIIYRRAYLAGSIVPNDNDAYHFFVESQGRVPPRYVDFAPLVYSLENSLPLVKLGQGENWHPAAAASGVKPNLRWSVPLRVSRWKWLHSKLNYIDSWITSPRFVRGFHWIQILLGWLFATLFIAGVAGVAQKP